MNDLLSTVCYTLPDALIWLVMGLVLGWTIREDKEERRHIKRGTLRRAVKSIE